MRSARSWGWPRKILGSRPLRDGPARWQRWACSLKVGLSCNLVLFCNLASLKQIMGTGGPPYNDSNSPGPGHCSSAALADQRAVAPTGCCWNEVLKEKRYFKCCQCLEHGFGSFSHILNLSLEIYSLLKLYGEGPKALKGLKSIAWCYSPHHPPATWQVLGEYAGQVNVSEQEPPTVLLIWE